MPAAPDPIAATVRSADHDRYLAALYAPADRRDALLALYAFNAEIAGIRDRVREPMAGEVRLQWWRDVIAAGVATGHPLADALIETIARHGLPRQAFDNYLEARIFDLYDDPMPSRVDLEGYCGETTGAMVQLAAMILDAKAAPAVADLAGHAGCAMAIVDILRLLPVHRRRGQCFVPRDVLAAAGTSSEAFVSGKGDAAAVGRAIAAMTALAREHHAAFRQRARDLPSALRPAFLPTALVPGYLAAVAKAGRIASGEMSALATWKKHWALFRAASGHW